MEAKVIKKVNSRLGASTSTPKIIPRKVGDTLNIVSFKFGEIYRGDPLWYVDDKNIHYTSSAIAVNVQGNRLNTLVDFPAIWRLASTHSVKVGIYDSGVTRGTPMLGDRIIQLNHDNGSITDHHGDYMATIIAGSDLIDGYCGFLPNATVYSYQSPKNTQDSHIVTLTDLKVALNKFLEQDVDVVNISMRSNTENILFEGDQDLKMLMKKYNDRNIFICCSVGQDNGKSDKSFYYPARLAGAFSVAGSFGINQPVQSLYFDTNLWTGVKVLAPSDALYTGNFFRTYKIPNTEGTSVSAAITSGVVGLLKVKHRLESRADTASVYVDSVISSMPELKLDPSLNDFISAKSFKILNFSTLKTILNS